MNRIKELRKKMGMRQKDLAAKLKIAQNTISTWENGLYEPDNQAVIKLAEIFDVTTDYILGRDSYVAPDVPAPTRPGSKWIPVLGYVRAGVPIEAVEEILDYEEITPEMARQGEHFALKIHGDSMEPKLFDGDIVIVRQQQTCEDNATAVVLVNGQDATVKRVKRRPEGIILMPNNPAYEPMFYSNAEIESLPVTVIGVAVELRRKF